MGKGDKRTAKGKRVMGTYGNSRKRKSTKPDVITKTKSKSSKAGTEKEAPAKKATTKKTAVKKPAAKKTTAKKATSKSEAK